MLPDTMRVTRSGADLTFSIRRCFATSKPSAMVQRCSPCFLSVLARFLLSFEFPCVSFSGPALLIEPGFPVTFANAHVLQWCEFVEQFREDSVVSFHQLVKISRRRSGTAQLALLKLSNETVDVEVLPFAATDCHIGGNRR